MPRSCSALSVATLLSALALATAASAQTADGETPAVEDICTTWGFTGQVNGLCKAYCEAMDCDDAAPQASEQACTRVLDKITTALGDTPFPTCDDADDDGVPNGLDNCPNVANADQADADPSTPEGDACEPVVTCPCLGSGDPAAPATIEAVIASAEDFNAQYSGRPIATSFCQGEFYAAQYVLDPVHSAAWALQADGLQCRLSAYVEVDGSEDILFAADEESLTPAEQAACQAVNDALVAADPLGVCTN